MFQTAATRLFTPQGQNRALYRV